MLMPKPSIREHRFSMFSYLFISIFILLCGPVIKISSNLNVDTALLYAIIVTSWSFFVNKSIIIERSIIMAVLILFIYILLVSIPIHFVISNRELPYAEIFKPIKIFLYATAIRFLANKLREVENLDFLSFVSTSIFYGITINSVFIILETFLPDFRSFLFEYFKGGIDLDEQIANRAGGLLLSGGAIASGFSGIGILFGYHSLLNPKNKYASLTILFIFINLIGAIFSGRTGIVIALVSSVYFFINTRYKARFIFFIGLIGLLLTLFITQLFSSILFQENQNVYISLSRFAVFLNGYFGTNLDTSFTIDERIEDFLFGSLRLPDNPLQTLFGMISFSNWNYNGKISDMGFQISLFRYGFMGFIFYYLVYFVLVFNIILKKHINYFGILVFLTLFLLETKESTMYARGLIIVMFFVYEMSITKLQLINSNI